MFSCQSVSLCFIFFTVCSQHGDVRTHAPEKIQFVFSGMFVFCHGLCLLVYFVDSYPFSLLMYL